MAFIVVFISWRFIYIFRPMPDDNIKEFFGCYRHRPCRPGVIGNVPVCGDHNPLSLFLRDGLFDNIISPFSKPGIDDLHMPIERDLLSCHAVFVSVENDGDVMVDSLPITDDQIDETGTCLLHILVINADDVIPVDDYVRNVDTSAIQLRPVRWSPADLLPHIFRYLFDIFRNLVRSAALRAAHIYQLSAEHQSNSSVTFPAGQSDCPLLSLEKQRHFNIT